MDTLRAIEALSALAQPTRMGVFRFLLSTYPESVPAGDVARHFDVPHNTMSAHLAVLTRAGLIAVRRDGRSMLYGADLAGFRTVVAFLARDCCGGRPEICEPVLSSALACACEPESANA